MTKFRSHTGTLFVPNIGLPLDTKAVFRYSADMDWIKVLADLSAAGYTQAQIASSCDCAQSTVSDLAKGGIKQPSFALGQAIVALHKKAIRKLRTMEQANG